MHQRWNDHTYWRLIRMLASRWTDETYQRVSRATAQGD